MTADPPLIQLTGIVKAYQALRPLRVANFSAGRHDRLVLSGFDAMAAEMFVYLVTGAALPDEGEVVIGGRNTREIATDTEWLASLDRFGIVTHRAVLLESTSVASNLALPLTVAIDPMSAETRARIESDASDVGLPLGKLDGPAHALTAGERLRLHLARAVSVGPELLMLEHPTGMLNDAGESAAFGQALRRISEARQFGFVALSDDQAFARASGAETLKLNPTTGRLGRRKLFGWL